MIAARKGTEPGLQTHSGFFSERAFSVNVQCVGVVQGAGIGGTAGLVEGILSAQVQVRT
jgi:hypothetical protein